MAAVSVAVMAHRSRAALVESLVEALDCEPAVIWATNPEPTTATEARWRTGRAAWEAFGRGATHHVVLQDDAEVCRDFRAGVTYALGVNGHAAASVTSWYYGNHAGPRRTHDPHAIAADESGAAWIVTRALRWGLAVCMPTEHIAPMLDLGDQYPALPYDTRVARYWTKQAGTPCWYGFPSLTEHRGDRSLVGHNPGRVAWSYLGADRSALEVDWTAGAPAATDRSVTV